MLYLYRRAGQSILIFDQDDELDVCVKRVRADRVDLAVNDAAMRLASEQSIVLLQGRVRIHLTSVTPVEENGRRDLIANLGFDAPPTMFVRRAELLRGTDRKFRASMRRS